VDATLARVVDEPEPERGVARVRDRYERVFPHAVGREPEREPHEGGRERERDGRGVLARVGAGAFEERRHSRESSVRGVPPPEGQPT
jgi:hypothetical protein